MLYLLGEFSDVFGPLRLFDYVTFRAGGAALTALLIVLFGGPATVRALRRFNVRAAERLEGLVPAEFIDKAKASTPCMGGLLLIGGVIVSSLLWTRLDGVIPPVLIGGVFGYAAIGFIDDYLKVARHNRDGLAARWKFLLLALLSAAVLAGFNCSADLHDLLLQLQLPFCKEPVLSSYWLFAFELVVLLGSANAVNLTDGKDGLATGCTIFCCLVYAGFAYFAGHMIFAKYLELPFIPGIAEAVVFASAVVGGCIGFLWHNCHPAAMFMGDTGSLALGGAVGMLAVLTRQEVLLLIVGGVFVLEALSVIIQVGSFRLTGRRVFLCTPIHHHFERKGWTETQIVVRFWILAGIFALMALATLKLR